MTLWTGLRGSDGVLKYEIILYWSDIDQVVIAEVPELPGCKTHGGTYEEALAMAREAMQGWIEVARELGRSIPEPRGCRLMSAWLPSRLHYDPRPCRFSVQAAPLVWRVGEEFVGV